MRSLIFRRLRKMSTSFTWRSETGYGNSFRDVARSGRPVKLRSQRRRNNAASDSTTNNFMNETYINTICIRNFLFIFIRFFSSRFLLHRPAKLEKKSKTYSAFDKLESFRLMSALHAEFLRLPAHPERNEFFSPLLASSRKKILSVGKKQTAQKKLELI